MYGSKLLGSTVVISMGYVLGSTLGCGGGEKFILYIAFFLEQGIDFDCAGKEEYAFPVG